MFILPQALVDSVFKMAEGKKGPVETMPMRILDERGIPYEPRQQARKQSTAEGVAKDLGVLIAIPVKRSAYGLTLLPSLVCPIMRACLAGSICCELLQTIAQDLWAAEIACR